MTQLAENSIHPVSESGKAHCEARRGTSRFIELGILEYGDALRQDRAVGGLAWNGGQPLEDARTAAQLPQVIGKCEHLEGERKPHGRFDTCG